MIQYILLCFVIGGQYINLSTMQQEPNLKTIEAVKNNQVAVVEKALKNGTNANIKDNNNRSLLLIATQAGHFEMARLLVTNGADVNMQDDKQDSPFLLAGAMGLTNFVQLYLDNGARFDVFNRYNGTALIPACERGHIETATLLAHTKAFPINHVNRLGWTALMEAVVLGDGSDKYVQIVRMLMEAGCDINIPDRQGTTALQHAKNSNYRAIAKVLER